MWPGSVPEVNAASALYAEVMLRMEARPRPCKIQMLSRVIVLTKGIRGTMGVAWFKLVLCRGGGPLWDMLQVDQDDLVVFKRAAYALRKGVRPGMPVAGRADVGRAPGGPACESVWRVVHSRHGHR